MDILFLEKIFWLIKRKDWRYLGNLIVSHNYDKNLKLLQQLLVLLEDITIEV